MKMKSSILRFVVPRLRVLGEIVVFAALVFSSFVVFAKLVASIPESVLPFPDRSIELSGMPATFQTAVLPKWEIGERIHLPTDGEGLTNKSQSFLAEAVYHEGEGSRLTVVVPGLSGNSTDAMNVWFARPFIIGGDSILILPSPSHPSFFEVYLKDFDFQFANQALCKVVKNFISGKHFQRQKVSSVLLAGYSLGGRNVLEMPGCLASFLQSQNLKLEVFSMNPPLDFKYAASVLDGALGDPVGIQTGEFAKALLFGLYTKLMGLSFGDFEGIENVDEPEVILTARRWAFFLENKDSALKKLIATLFAYKLQPTVQFASRDKQIPVDGEAPFSFQVLASGREEARPASLDQILRRMNEVSDQTNGRLFVLHSFDDFLIRARDLERLATFAPKHVLALPSGGHVGAIFKLDYSSGFGRGRSIGIFPPVHNP